MKTKIFDRNEMMYLGILFVVCAIAFQVAFHKENMFSNLRIVFSLFFLCVVPGYFVMLYWKEKMGFVERVIAGTLLCAGFISALSYYLGLVGVNIRYNAFLLPVVLSAAGILLVGRKK